MLPVPALTLHLEAYHTMHQELAKFFCIGVSLQNQKALCVWSKLHCHSAPHLTFAAAIGGRRSSSIGTLSFVVVSFGYSVYRVEPHSKDIRTSYLYRTVLLTS